MAEINDLFKMYKFRHEDDIRSILEHPCLKGKKPGEWKMKEMMEEGLVESFRIMQIKETENGRFRFICNIQATFNIPVGGKDGSEIKEVSYNNLFGTNIHMDLGAEQIAYAFAKNAVTDGEGEFLLDIWADSIYNGMTEIFEKGGNGKCFTVGMYAKHDIQTNMRFIKSSEYFNIWCEKEKFLLGDMWYLGMMDVENKCLMMACKKEGMKSEDDRLFNIVTDNGKLLWKHWVTLRGRVWDNCDGMLVEVPGYDKPVHLDWRRFCFGTDEENEKKVERVEFYKDGGLMSDREVREFFDRDDELKVIWIK